MIRKSPRHKGVHQRCRADCPPLGQRCRRHPWEYYLDLRPHGEQITKGGFETATEAAEARAETQRAVRRGQLASDRTLTVGRYLPDWVADRVERGEISANTEHAYRSAITNHLIPKLGHVKLAELRGRHITRAYTKMMREREEAITAAKARNAAYAEDARRVNEQRAAGGLRPVKPKRVGLPRTLGPVSIERIHACLSAALNAAVEDELIQANPAARAKKPKAKRHKVVPPEPEQYGRFLDEVMSDRQYPLWVLLGYSGLRRGEACGLKWPDLDLSTGRIVVRRERVTVNHKVIEKEAKTEAGEDRVVFLDQDALAVLKAWRKRQLEERMKWGPAYSDDGYIFTRESGEPLHPNSVTKRYSRLAAKHGMAGTSPHTLRHFRASALISSGADIGPVSKTMGHKNISVTSDIYGHLFEKAAEEVAAKAEGFVPRRKAG